MKTPLLIVLLTAACLWLSSCGKPEPEPLLPQEVTDFHALYSENCAACHGINGKTQSAVQPLNDPLWLALAPKDVIRHTIEYGRPGTLMAAFGEKGGGQLTEKQVDSLVNGIEAWAKPEAVQGIALPPYASTTAGDANQGQHVYQTVCAVCHGEKGVGGVINDPSFLGLISDQAIRTTILAGWPGHGMPDWRSLRPGHPLTDQEITDVVAYLSSQRSPLQTKAQNMVGQ